MSNMYSEELIEEIRSQNDIVDVISGYVPLKRSGSSYKARCPFHTEKTPSFSVSPDKQIYHCFGCGEGGNVISFIMRIENLGFVDALKILADRAGIILPDKNHFQDKKIYKKKLILYEIHTQTARYYFENLKNNRRVLNYLNSRNITANTIIKFGLGFAPDDWEGLYRYLLSKNFSLDDIADSGLVLSKRNEKNRYYDRFRNRLIFPVFNLTNKVVAFGGRVLDETLPKYLNSPETQIFTKGRHLYGLQNAKNNIVDGQIIMVEGYMDVISLFQYGIKNAVASLGTSLTKEQAKLLNRYADEVVIAFDGDEAGQNATLKALEQLSSVGCKAKVIQLPNNMDPDEYIKEFKMEGFYHQIKKALSAVEYKIRLAREKNNILTTEGKIDFTKEAASILKNIKSEIEIDAYIKKISRETGIDEAAIKYEVYRYKGAKISQKNKTGNNRNTIQYENKVVPVERKNAVILAEENLINILSQDLNLFQMAKKHIDWEDFTDDFHKKIAQFIFERMSKKETVQPAQLLDFFHSKGEANRISAIFSKHLDESHIHENMDEYINTIRIHKVQSSINDLNQKLSDPHIKNNREMTNRIFIEMIDLKKKLEALKDK